MEVTPFIEQLITQAPALAILLYLLYRLDKRLETMQNACFEEIRQLIDKLSDKD